jgi:hypothetical protein
MCLEVHLVPGSPEKVSVERLSEASGLRIAKTTVGNRLHMSLDGGCSCSLLSNGADWNNPIWDFEASVRPRIAKALELLAEEADGFTFQALWIGDSVETTEHVPLRKVVADVLENQVKNKHLYIVGKAKRDSASRYHAAP